MSNIKNILLLIIIFCALTNPSKSQTKEKKFTLTGQISNPPQNLKIIKLLYYRNYFSSDFPNYAKELKSNVINGKFAFSSNDIDKLGYIQIVIDSGKYNKFSTEQFLVEPNDDVKIKISENAVAFSGKGSAKYEISHRIAQADYFPHSTSGMGYPKTLEILSDVVDSVYLMQSKYLLANKTNVSDGIYKILKVNAVYSNRVIVSKYLSRMGVFNSISLHDPAYEKLTVKNNRYVPNEPYVTANLNSNSYTDFLYHKIYYDAILHGLTVTDEFSMPKKRFSFLFNTIFNTYSGLLRQKLLISLLNSGETLDDDSTALYLKKCMEVTNLDSRYYKIMLDEKKFARGSNVYNFSLQDSSDRVFRLSDFKGKILILDLYYYGCHACAELNKAMPPVIDKYKNNPNVVFITVNQDNKTNFIKALKTGLYTHEGSINLYTNGKKLDDPFIKYYSLNYAPQMMVIDKNGRIIAMNPLRPMLSYSGSGGKINPDDPGTLHLIELIEEGLASK